MPFELHHYAMLAKFQKNNILNILQNRYKNGLGYVQNQL